MLKTHPAAEDLKRLLLMPLLMNDKEYVGGFYSGFQIDERLYQVIIIPSNIKEYFWLNVMYVHDKYERFMKRPVASWAIPFLLNAAMEPIPSNVQWGSSERKPSKDNPFIHIQMRSGKIMEQIYFIQGEITGLIKIGKAEDIYDRLRNFQCGSPDRLNLIGEMEENELELHKRFAHLRVHGEWFFPAPELLDFIKENTNELKHQRY